MDTMLAAVFKGDGILEVEKVPVPHIQNPDHVLVKVLATSICGSDLHILSVPPGQYGKPGTIMGHEFYGKVESVGENVRGVGCGDLVAIDPIVTCGICDDCRAGNRHLCLNASIIGQTLDGGFAQYCVVPAEQLYPVAQGIPSHVAVQAEPLSCVMNGISKLKPMPNDKVIIFGCGNIGLTFIRVLCLYGITDILACARSGIGRENARLCGASLTANPETENLKELMELHWGSLADIVIDAVGAGSVMENGLPLLRGGGRFLAFGQDSNETAQIQPAVITRNELSIIGTYCSHFTFPVATEMLGKPELGMDRLVSHRLELKDILEGLALIRQKKAIRVVLYPNGIL